MKYPDYYFFPRNFLIIILPILRSNPILVIGMPVHKPIQKQENATKTPPLDVPKRYIKNIGGCIEK